MNILGDTYESTEVTPGVYHHVFTNHIDKTPEQRAAQSLARRFSLTTTCLKCNAAIHGEWVGDSPYTLQCAVCNAVHIVEFTDEPCFETPPLTGEVIQPIEDSPPVQVPPWARNGRPWEVE